MSRLYLLPFLLVISFASSLFAQDANEEVVESFLEHSLPFGAMVPIVAEVLGTITHSENVTLEAVVAKDTEARELTRKIISSQKVNS